MLHIFQSEKLNQPFVKWTLVLALFTIILWATLFFVQQYQNMFAPIAVVEEKAEMSIDTVLTEADIRAQLEALAEQSKDLPKLSEEDVVAQLESLSSSSTESDKASAPTQDEIRAQLEALNGLNSNR